MILLCNTWLSSAKLLTSSTVWHGNRRRLLKGREREISVEQYGIGRARVRLQWNPPSGTTTKWSYASRSLSLSLSLHHTEIQDYTVQWLRRSSAVTTDGLPELISTWCSSPSTYHVPWVNDLAHQPLFPHFYIGENNSIYSKHGIEN